MYLLYDNVFVDDFICFGINSMKEHRCPLVEKKKEKKEKQEINHSVYQLSSLPVSPSVRQSVSPSVRQSASPPVSQSVIQSLSHSVTQSVRP